MRDVVEEEEARIQSGMNGSGREEQASFM